MPKSDDKKLRINNALKDKLFYIDSEIKSPTLKLYKILGTSGNIYDVTLTNETSCTCPDFITRHKKCKHIYFVIIKLLKLQNIDKKKYTDDELKQIIQNADITTGFNVNTKILSKYEKIKNDNNTKLECNPKTDDSCPICMDDILNGEKFIHCKYSCGKCVHDNCFKLWVKNKKKSNCVFCNKDLFVEKIIPKKGDYINLF